MNRRSFLSKLIGAAAFGALAKAFPRKPAAAPAELVPNPAWVEAPHEVHFEMSPETFQRWYGGKLHENRIQGMAHDLVQVQWQKHCLEIDCRFPVRYTPPVSNI